MLSFIVICMYILKFILNLKECLPILFCSVCVRWYSITKCSMLWKYVDAHDMQLTSYQVQKLVPILPSSVKYLRICSLSTQQRIPFITPRTAIEIRERCPQLKTLIIESAFIAKHINFTDITVEDLPQKLCILSLRKSFFHTDQFFCSISHPTVPKIQILDCSNCWCVTDNDLPFFSRLSDLQELYLAGCPITDAGSSVLLKAIPNLKVLDLEGTGIGRQTINSLNQFCKSLERLYLGFTGLTDEYLSILEGTSLPVLHTLCVRRTLISCAGIKSVIVSISTLKYINAALCGIAANCSLDLLVHPCARKMLNFEFEDKLDDDICEHFLKRNNGLGY